VVRDYRRLAYDGALDPRRAGPVEPSFGVPELLTLQHPAEVRCAELLGMERA
jgi:hypothetical protein